MKLALIINNAIANLIGLFYTTLLCIKIGIMLIKHPTRIFKLFSQKHRSRPQVLDDPVYGDSKYFSLKSGIRIHAKVSGAESAPLMVLLHGFPEFWFSWRHQIIEFQKTHRVIAMDMRGYNESSKPVGISSYQVALVAGDVKDLLEQYFDGRKCTLIGHDWGGGIAWTVAMLFPHILDHLIILNCPHSGVFQKFMRSSWKQFKKSWYIFVFQLPYVAECYLRLGDLHFLDDAFRGRAMGVKDKQSFTQEDVEVYKYVYGGCGSLTPPVNYYRAALRYPLPGSVTHKVITGLPVLVVWGTADGALEEEMADLSGTLVEKGNFHVKKLPGVSHWVQQDQAGAVNDAMRQFLRK